MKTRKVTMVSSEDGDKSAALSSPSIYRRRRYFKNLVALPVLSPLSNLTLLDLTGCIGLTTLPGPPSLPPNLTLLDLWGCHDFKVLPDLSSLPNLQVKSLSKRLSEWEKSGFKRYVCPARRNQEI